MTTEECVSLCRSCAADIWATRPPNDRYAAATASLLMGTAATESHLHYRRQTVFDWTTDRGAWGLWQTESAAVEDSLALLLRNVALSGNAARWLAQQEDANLEWLFELSTSGVLRLISICDRLACLFARLHYLRVPAAIPASHEERAAYYKRYYNTYAGAGSVSKYLDDYARYFGDMLT